jgi:hypothetical protein
VAGGLEIEGRMARLRVVLDFSVAQSEVLIGPEGALLVVTDEEAFLTGLGDYEDLRAGLNRITREAFDPSHVHVDEQIGLANGREVIVPIASEGLVTVEAGTLLAALREIGEPVSSRVRAYVQQLLPPTASVSVAETRVELASGTLEATVAEAPADGKQPAHPAWLAISAGLVLVILVLVLVLV